MAHKKKTFRLELVKLTMAASISGMLILGVTLILISMYSFSGKASEDMEFYLSNINGQFDSKIQYLENIIITLRHNPVLNGFFTENGYKEEAANVQLAYNGDLFSDQNMVNEKNPFIVRMYLFNQKGQFVRNYFYPYTEETMFALDKEYLRLWNEFEKGVKEYYYVRGEDVVNIFFNLYDEKMEEMGTCAVAVSLPGLETIFRDLEKYSPCIWLVRGKDGEIITAVEDAGRVDSAEIFWGRGRTESTNHEGVGEQGKGIIGEQKYLYHVVETGFGLSAMAAVGNSTIYGSVKPSIVLFVIIFFVMVAVIAVMVFFIALRFTRPLRTVAENIKTFGTGDLDTRLESFDLQEFDDISVVFNEMTQRIHYLITQVYEKQLLATQSQVKYLQSQINPHFMFNILSMIGMRAKLDGNDEVYSMLSAFSSLVQGKIFRKDGIMIPLFQEMELVEFYLYLQSKRFTDRITYEIRYENQELKQVRIPRLCIEPLVENAVSHGLEPKEGTGHIQVEVERQGECLVITVKDDGVGFEPDRVELQAKEGHTHVSLANTKKLLQILYGDKPEKRPLSSAADRHGGTEKGVGAAGVNDEQNNGQNNGKNGQEEAGYGIEIDSSPGRGTSVTVRLPIGRNV